MLTEIGTVALIFIVASLSIFLNTMLITFIISNEDIETIINIAIFSSTINNIFLFAWFYIIVAVTLLLNLDFNLDKISNIISLHALEYFVEMVFVFILPIAFLFWTDITYSFRVLLGIISVLIGVIIFVQKMIMENIVQKVLATIVYIVIIFIINMTIINGFGIDRIPAKRVKARIGENRILLNMEAKNIENPLFQLNNNPQTRKTTVYKIIASVPFLGLNLGYKVATIPNREFKIKATNNVQYTVYDQYNNQELLKLNR